MNMSVNPETGHIITDLMIIGGGVNGCGIARDAAGRGLSVTLVEMDDLGGATSSASTKLFHGGLRYLEYFKFRLVRESLIEREILLCSMPHISWPLRFVLPFDTSMRFDALTPATKWLNYMMPWLNSRRPFWLIRLGLFCYDTLGGRKILPPTKSLNLENSEEGAPLKAKFKRALEYSDCWVEDSRLVILNARDAQKRGATILPRVKLIAAERGDKYWILSLQDQITGQKWQQDARYLVNAAGPWVQDILGETLRLNVADSVRLVRGSHLVVKRQYEHDKAYFFQGKDGRIIFAIPYEQDFTLIGTTDVDHDAVHTNPICTDEEQEYLLKFASEYFKNPITSDDIIWRYSGVRPLYEDGANAAASATRDYVLRVDSSSAPIVTIFGGKITTYRKLAESALSKITPFFELPDKPWTAHTALPGGDFEVAEFADLIEKLMQNYSYLSFEWARRLIRLYGTEAWDILNNSKTASDLGKQFGCYITEQELSWSIRNEWTQNADDFLWRRTRLGLKLKDVEIKQIAHFIKHFKTQKTG